MASTELAPDKPAPMLQVTCWQCHGDGLYEYADGYCEFCRICAGRGYVLTDGKEVE